MLPFPSKYKHSAVSMSSVERHFVIQTVYYCVKTNVTSSNHAFYPQTTTRTCKTKIKFGFKINVMLTLFTEYIWLCVISVILSSAYLSSWVVCFDFPKYTQPILCFVLRSLTGGVAKMFTRWWQGKLAHENRWLKPGISRVSSVAPLIFFSYRLFQGACCMVICHGWSTRNGKK